jgi:glycosyltransferase involved in cell wall biosynthesis
VDFKGWVSREEQRLLLAAADVYVQASLPGLGEWMPRTILEAMAMGLPVVASTVGGIEDVVTARHGALVPGGDRVALAEALANLVGDRERRVALGLNARAVAVRHYGWQDGFELYRKALHGMC